MALSSVFLWPCQTVKPLSLADSQDEEVPIRGGSGPWPGASAGVSLPGPGTRLGKPSLCICFCR